MLSIGIHLELPTLFHSDIVKYQCQNNPIGVFHHRPNHFSLALLFFFFLQESSTNGGSQSSSNFSRILYIIQIDFLLPRVSFLIVLWLYSATDCFNLLILTIFNKMSTGSHKMWLPESSSAQHSRLRF